jgi:predicted Mrr-cat superfamily restriction endonuclease
MAGTAAASASTAAIGEVKTTHFRLRDRWDVQLGQGEKVQFLKKQIKKMHFKTVINHSVFA